MKRNSSEPSRLGSRINGVQRENLWSAKPGEDIKGLAVIKERDEARSADPRKDPTKYNYKNP